MKGILKILLVVSLILSISGCDSGQYQVVTGSDGELYRFNKKTGEMSIIREKEKKAIAASRKSAAVPDIDESSLEKPADWKESRYPGKNLKVRLETVWRENKLCYKFSVYPYKSLEKIIAKKKQDYVYSLLKPGFNIELVDANGFMVKEIKVNLWNMTKVPDESGNTKELMMNSQIECSKQSYKSIGGYTVKWQLEPELIEDEKVEYIKSEPIKSEKR